MASVFQRSLLCLLLAVSLLTPWFAAAGDQGDPVTAWKRWKDISDAVALRPLDGPTDIVEKAEIIEDRVDELTREAGRLRQERQAATQRLTSLEDQREILRDVAEVHQGGDTEMRQRLHDLAERIQRERQQMEAYGRSVTDLGKELDRLRGLASQYRAKAEEIRRKESQSR